MIQRAIFFGDRTRKVEKGDGIDMAIFKSRVGCWILSFVFVTSFFFFFFLQRFVNPNYICFECNCLRKLNYCLFCELTVDEIKRSCLLIIK